MGGGIFFASVFTFIVPFTVSSPFFVVAARILTGLVEGLAVPASYEMIGKWFPKTETSFAYELSFPFYIRTPEFVYTQNNMLVSR